MTPESTSQNPQSRDLILQSAVQLFGEKGFKETTIKDISEHCGLNVSLVSYHFGGKEGLYRACFESIGQSRLHRIQAILGKPPFVVQSLEEVRVRLTLLADTILTAHVEEAALQRLIQRECEAPEPLIEDIFTNTFLQIWKMIGSFLSEAQSHGFLGAQFDPTIATGMLMHTLMQTGRMDHLAARYFHRTIQNPEYRRHASQQIIHLLLFGTSPSQPQNQSQKEPVDTFTPITKEPPLHETSPV